MEPEIFTPEFVDSVGRVGGAVALLFAAGVGYLILEFSGSKSKESNVKKEEEPQDVVEIVNETSMSLPRYDGLRASVVTKNITSGRDGHGWVSYDADINLESIGGGICSYSTWSNDSAELAVFKLEQEVTDATLTRPQLAKSLVLNEGYLNAEADRAYLFMEARRAHSDMEGITALDMSEVKKDGRRQVLDGMKPDQNKGSDYTFVDFARDLRDSVNSVADTKKISAKVKHLAELAAIFYFSGAVPNYTGEHDELQRNRFSTSTATDFMEGNVFDAEQHRKRHGSGYRGDEHLPRSAYSDEDKAAVNYAIMGNLAAPTGMKLVGSLFARKELKEQVAGLLYKALEKMPEIRQNNQVVA
tara:strand:- start:4147 stop:5220 length:1074 start_codon:yes stop_codon:yes gene_type:complete